MGLVVQIGSPSQPGGRGGETLAVGYDFAALTTAAALIPKCS